MTRDQEVIFFQSQFQEKASAEGRDLAAEHAKQNDTDE